jgi:hypothetical protein|tara:strand:+ start:304 stop:1011 length:708 start_codon:yes stop_codon:yes gene_type:complete
LFGVGYIPHHIVLGGDGEVLYSASGFNQTAIVTYINQGLENLDQDFDNDGIMDNEDNCVDGYNPNQADTDGDLIGDICDACNNLIWTGGDVNGDLNISLEDILLLVDIILGDNDSQCGYEAGNVNGDGVINILDVIGLVQRILGGSSQQAIQFLETLLDESTFNKLLPKLSVYPNPSNGNVNILGNGLINIYDMNGRVVEQKNINNNYLWNTSDVPSGIYFLISDYKKAKITILK